MNMLTTLYAEQSSPDEIVVFLLLGTVATLLLAFLLYALLIYVLSKWRLPKRHTLWEILFPPAAQLREYAAEYTLGCITAILLGLTVAAKHDAVEAILATDIAAIGNKTVREALPLGGLSARELEAAGESRDRAERLADWVETGVAEDVSVGIESIVRPLLKSGMEPSAFRLVNAVVDWLGPSASSLLSRTLLLTAAVLLLLGYILWFGRQRWQELREDEIVDPKYANFLKRLSLPAVCIPLLFVTALAVGNPDRLAKSAVGAASMSTADDEAPLAAVIEQQATRLSSGERDPPRAGGPTAPSSASADIDRMLEELSRLGAVVDGLRADLEKAEQTTLEAPQGSDGLSERVGKVEQISGELSSELQLLRENMSQLGDDRALLLVVNQNGPYRIRASSAPPGGGGERGGAGDIAGNFAGLHALDPGDYVVTGDGLNPQPASLKARGVVTLMIPVVIR